MADHKIAVVIPCYNVKRHVLQVISEIGAECTRIYAVDDACPHGSGDFIEEHCKDARVKVLRNSENQGVGGAVITGYRAALADGMDIAVKVDGDGQMDPTLLPYFVQPILDGLADYTKGNRFQSFYAVRQMPKLRLIGNAGLSFMTKLSSGYWQLFDPTNGYTAIHREVLSHIDLDKLGKRYFFETDMLIALGDQRAVVMDIPMEAKYGDEESGLRARSVFLPFFFGHLRAGFRRLFYSYLLRDFNLASINLIVGLVMLVFGTLFGSLAWYQSSSSGEVATTGTVMIAVLPIILGVQLLLFFLSYDIANKPTVPLQRFSRAQLKRPRRTDEDS